MQTDTVTGNKLIAEFDGLEQDGNYWYRPTGNTEGLMYTNKYRRLEYHTSWDWLMPVLEKIKSLGFNIDIYMTQVDNSVQINRNGEDRLNILYYSDLKENLYVACVQFIQWYNQSKK